MFPEVLARAWRRIVPDRYAVFRSRDENLLPHRERFHGRVLNAGAGWFDISHLVPGELINLDLPDEKDQRTNIHLRATLDAIPVESDHFDAIICLAVREHVREPDAVMRELFRVMKPGGCLLLDVPFLQPEHLCPTDFQRYTRDGLERVATRAGFVVEDVKPTHNIYTTLYWICWEWLHAKPRHPLYVLARPLVLWPLLWRARHSKTQSQILATAFQLTATKPLSR
jgi:SAM-dependent methyltransferase